VGVTRYRLVLLRSRRQKRKRRRRARLERYEEYKDTTLDTDENYLEGDEMFHDGEAWRVVAVEGGGVLRCVRSPRAYRTTHLPTLRPEIGPDRQGDALDILYGEVCSAWRTLVDVRFKLLALVPAVSGVAIAKLIENSDKSGWLALAAVGGLLVTFGIFVYDRRNSAVHDDLISRGRRIEAELGVCTGLFLGRRGEPRPYLRHDAALYLIYGTVSAAWIAAAVVALLR
jgi:hypothetical protein